MKITFLDSDTLGEDISLSVFDKLGEFRHYKQTTPGEVEERISDTDILIVNKVVMGKEQMDNAPRLKLICVAATGMNNIDLDYAESKGILVKNAVGYSTDSVAQTTFMHLLNLVGNGSFYDRYVKSGDYCKSSFFSDLSHPFFEIKNKKLGIIGLGNIGKRVAEIARVFGMEVFYYPTSGVAHSKEYQALSLEELLTQCDIITIHAPLNEKTNNLIGYEQLSLMKKEGIILNMGRGGIINEKDLARALNEEVISKAGIDVFEKEPISQDSPYYSIKYPERVMLTPHIAWASREARELLVEKIADNIKNFLKSYA